MIAKYDISTIELAMRNALKQWGVAPMVYNNRPKAASHSDSFAVVKVVGSVTDMACFAECTLSISLFVKDDREEKNDVRLGIMYETLRTHLPAGYTVVKDGTTVGDYLFSTTPTIIGDVADDYGYHARVIKIQTIIKTI